MWFIPPNVVGQVCDLAYYRLFTLRKLIILGLSDDCALGFLYQYCSDSETSNEASVPY
jgi:hypothetical protein